MRHRGRLALRRPQARAIVLAVTKRPTAPSCPFCSPELPAVAQNLLAVAVRDGFPVNPGHTLVIPRRHVASWFEATPEERAALVDLLDVVKCALDEQLAPDGYNVGFNDGPAAGQTVMHLHIHVIPRFKGDVDDPSGGVRFSIPARGSYRRPGFIPRARERRDGGE